MRPTKRRDAGFSLAVLIFFATAAAILLTTAIPVYRFQAQREREEELLFRGEEYMRAIQKYQRRFGVYPQSLDVLQQQNGLRFLRRLYLDPTTNKPFRLIYLNPDGSLTGSKVFTQNITNTTQANNLNGNSNSNPNSNTNANPNSNLNSNSNTGFNTNPGFNSNPNQNPGGNRNNTNANANPNANTNANPNAGGNRNPAGTNSGPGNGGQNQTFGTSGIIGVASDTDQPSIKVYNGRQKYDEWEFLAILGQTGVNNNNPAPNTNSNTNTNSNPNANPNANGANNSFNPNSNGGFNNFNTNPNGNNNNGFNPNPNANPNLPRR